jgi:hypothetical protein
VARPIVKSKKPAGISPAGFSIQKPIEGSQYVRGNPLSIAEAFSREADTGSRNENASNLKLDAEVFRAGLAALAVDLRFERDLLTFIERAQASTFDGADMNENVGAAIVGLDESEALGCVKPLHCSGSHFTISKMR